MLRYIIFGAIFIVGMLVAGYGYMYLNDDYKDKFLKDYYSENSEEYEASFRQSFMESCAGNDNSLLNYCECVHSGLIKLGVYGKESTDLVTFFNTKEVKDMQQECVQSTQADAGQLEE